MTGDLFRSREEVEQPVEHLEVGDVVRYSKKPMGGRPAEGGGGVIKCIWFYDGPVVDVIRMDGVRVGLHPELGDEIVLVSRQLPITKI